MCINIAVELYIISQLNKKVIPLLKSSHVFGFDVASLKNIQRYPTLLLCILSLFLHHDEAQSDSLQPKHEQKITSCDLSHHIKYFEYY